ncbi:amidohydrolase family protein [Mycobacterium haemophilum]|uniref:amidohydrolase family protein n=1 Tax=Mycobacterium haemophilum TaxID=29311 RepID=UPI001B3C7EA7|nr:amidohydrolase family protein [Mycobacterium haemophilum]MCV7339967.1 amidohydrolase family protein [Mycobacterium haemophilum DSM 44634]
MFATEAESALRSSSRIAPFANGPASEFAAAAVFTTGYPFCSMRAARQFFEQMPINPADKEKIAHLNAERLLGLPK